MPRKSALPIFADDNPQLSSLFRDFSVLAGTDASDLINFRFQARRDGVNNNVYIQKIAGYAALGNDAGAYASLGGGHYYKSDGTSKRFITFDGAANSDIYELVTATWTAASRSLTAGKESHYEQFKDSLYVANGVDAVQRYNGTAWASLAGGTPMSGANNCAQFVRLYNNMMVYAKSINNPNRVWFSDANDAETVGASNYFDFHGAITGLVVLGSMLVVTTAEKIYVMVGQSPTTMVRYEKSAKYGCLAPRSLKAIDTPRGREVWFVANDNCVRAFNGETTRRVGYDYLMNTWANVSNGSISIAAAVVYDNAYWLAVPYSSSTYNNKMLVCDPRFETEIWIGLENWNAKFLDSYNNGGTEVIWFGEASADSVAWTFPSGYTTQKPSASTAVSMTFTTCNLDEGQPYLIKKFKKLYLQIKAIGSANLLIERNIDEYGWSGLRFGSAASAYIDMAGNNPLWAAVIWAAFTWGGTNYVPSPDNRGLITGKGKLIKYRYSDSQTVAQTEIYNMQHFYIPKKIK